jgi:hypothetical protein
MAIFDQEKKNNISSCKFFLILGHQTLDPDPESGSAIRKNAGSGSVSGSALNKCGSETLTKTIHIYLLKANGRPRSFTSKVFLTSTDYLTRKFL